MKSLPFVLSIALLLSPAFCQAKNAELLCSYNVAADEGGYRIVASDSLNVLKQVTEKGTFSIPADAPKNIVAIMCARSFSLPVVADALVLKAGYALYIASSDDLGNQTLLNLEFKDNAVTYKMVSGTLSDGQTISLGKIIKEMNQAYFTKTQSKP